MSFIFNVPTKVIFGPNSLDKLVDENIPYKKACIITSNGSSTIKNGSLARLQNILSRKGIRYLVCNKIEANPTDLTLDGVVEYVRYHECDFLIGLGGGSVLDSTTIVSAVAPNKGHVWDYIQSGTGGKKELINKALPYIEITTSAGTGSEVDRWGVVSRLETNEKIGFMGDYPLLSIVDPMLMLSVPPKFTVYQGFDALFHSLEGYISKFSNEASEIVQENAIRNIWKYLPIAYKDGTNLEARTKMALANTLSGYSMEVGSCTSEHSIEHALSGFAHELPHGAGLIMISVAYFKLWIKNHVCDDRFIKLARFMGNENATKPEDFITQLEKLIELCDVKDLKMSDYKIKKSDLKTIAPLARSAMPGLFACDRFNITDKDVEQILLDSYK